MGGFAWIVGKIGNCQRRRNPEGSKNDTLPGAFDDLAFSTDKHHVIFDFQQNPATPVGIQESPWGSLKPKHRGAVLIDLCVNCYRVMDNHSQYCFLLLASHLYLHTIIPWEASGEWKLPALGNLQMEQLVLFLISSLL